MPSQKSEQSSEITAEMPEIKFSRDPSAGFHDKFLEHCHELNKSFPIDGKMMGILRSVWEDGYGTGISECLGLNNKRLLFEGEDKDGRG